MVKYSIFILTFLLSCNSNKEVVVFEQKFSFNTFDSIVQKRGLSSTRQPFYHYCEYSNDNQECLQLVKVKNKLISKDTIFEKSIIRDINTLWEFKQTNKIRYIVWNSKFY